MITVMNDELRAEIREALTQAWASRAADRDWFAIERAIIDAIARHNAPAVDFLMRREWSKRGQCPSCDGVTQAWYGSPHTSMDDPAGHAPDCELAAALRAVGAPVLMRRGA